MPKLPSSHTPEAFEENPFHFQGGLAGEIRIAYQKQRKAGLPKRESLAAALREVAQHFDK
jgi:hypothetical protein